MRYFIVQQGSDIITAEKFEKPTFVYRQKNGMIVACSERLAQGILSEDGSTIYQLHGKDSLNLENEILAIETVMTEYDNVVAGIIFEDIEDTQPVVPEDTTEEKILTRAELTAEVNSLKQELQQIKTQTLGVE